MCKSLHRLCFSIVWMWETLDLSDLFIFDRVTGSSTLTLPFPSTVLRFRRWPCIQKCQREPTLGPKARHRTAVRCGRWTWRRNFHRVSQVCFIDFKGVIVRLVIMPYLPRWLLNACFCLFWWNVLTAILFGWEHWGSRLFGGRGCVMHCTLPCLRHPVSLLGMIRWTRGILSSETHISPVATQQPWLHLWHLLCSFLKKSELVRSCTYTFCLFWVD